MAFTLVELLVVIAIIIVLVSLLMVGVFKALDLAYEANTRTDITQLAAAVQSFQTKYQLNYIPSRIILCKQRANYFNPVTGAYKSQLHQDSLEYLGRVWPRLNWGTVHPRVDSAKWTGAPVWVGIDWDNSDALDDIGSPALFVRDASNNPVATTEVTLEGEQSFVFFLGGINGSGTVNGFSTDQTNPARHLLVFPTPTTVNTDDRIPPFFEFKSNRLISLSQLVLSLGGSPVGLNDFYVYKDGYGKAPYAYFSSYKTANGYNRYYLPNLGGLPNPVAGTSDCQTLGVWPYAQSWGNSPVYLNAQTYQIISAGKDTNFGAGSNPSLLATWTPANATAIYPQGSAGYDDVANFYDRLLGVPTTQ
jgi:type II secretory pathway pseudopilin PulG